MPYNMHMNMQSDSYIAKYKSGVHSVIDNRDYI